MFQIIMTIIISIKKLQIHVYDLCSYISIMQVLKQNEMYSIEFFHLFFLFVQINKTVILLQSGHFSVKI